MQTALVTGGAGFIVSNLVRLLLNNQHRVRIIDNLSTGYQKNIQGLNVDFTQGDIRDAGLAERLCQGVDVVFHLAASVGRQKSLNNPQLDSKVNLIGTTNILEAARKSGIGRVVYTSSAAIFGELLTMPIAAYSDEIVHRFRLMSASKERSRTGKIIINQLDDMSKEQRSLL